MLWLLIVPSLICAYFIFLRPVLKAIPALKTFYTEADGFWAKVWAIVGKSVTVVWGASLSGAGVLFQWLDPIAAFLGDPDFKAQIMEMLKNHPEYLAYTLMGISGITIAARMRSIAKG